MRDKEGGKERNQKWDRQKGNKGRVVWMATEKRFWGKTSLSVEALVTSAEHTIQRVNLSIVSVMDYDGKYGWTFSKEIRIENATVDTE